MNAERRGEVKNLVNETEEIKRQVNLQLAADHPKYQDGNAWREALTTLSDKLSDILMEERDALQAEAWEEPKETPEHADLTEAVIHMEHALNHCNAALDSVESKDFEQARTELDGLIHQLNKAIDS